MRLLASDLTRLRLGDVRTDVDLRRYTSWRAGGRADLMIAPRSTEELPRLLTYFFDRGIRWAVVGGGSNLFFDDAGVRIPLLHIGQTLSAIEIEGDLVHAEAGAWAPLVALKAMRAGLAGIEHSIGIPGTFGGLVLMNGGSQRQGVGDAVSEVEVVQADGRRRWLTRKECGFAYRRSRLQNETLVVLGATLKLEPGERRHMRRRMLDIMASRRRRFPRDLPKCGSVFVSDPALYASFGPPGAVIEASGLKGARRGDAIVSPRHANFIVNLGNARAADILALIQRVRQAVATRTGHSMRCEVRFMNADGDVLEAHDWLDDPRWSDAPVSVESVHG
jgi:UDP-N-acetylmuramate dehydrogenase